MQPKTIESAYQEFIDQVATVFEHKPQFSRSGDHVTRNTWLCAAAYVWSRMKRLLLVETEKERNALAYGIKEDIEIPKNPKHFRSFTPRVSLKCRNLIWPSRGQSRAEPSETSALRYLCFGQANVAQS